MKKNTSGLKVYIAGPISGTNVEETFKDFNTRKSILESLGYEAYSPLTGKGYLRTDKIFRPKDNIQPVSTNRAIIGRDRWMVGHVDIVYMDLSKTNKVSIGCMFELAWAYELRKHIVVVIPEGSVHQHGMVLQAGDIVFEKTEDALSYLKELVRSLEKEE